MKIFYAITILVIVSDINKFSFFISFFSFCSEITSVVWYRNRILCCGWNKHVTELAVFEPDICKKNWTTSHTDDILCSAASFPHLATGTYNGELILWRLETGQPFRKYQVFDVGKR